MKNEKKVFVQGVFKDFTNQERVVTFCAISEEGKGTIYSQDSYDDLTKQVIIGVSVQRSGDIVDNELGKKIAEGKARKEKSRLGTIYVTKNSLISRDIVETILHQQLDFFKETPGTFIKGYNKDKELFTLSPDLYYKKYSIIK